MLIGQPLKQFTFPTPATVTGGGLSSISLPGIERVNLNSASRNLTVNGTTGDDQISFTTTGERSTLVGPATVVFKTSVPRGLVSAIARRMPSALPVHSMTTSQA